MPVGRVVGPAEQRPAMAAVVMTPKEILDIFHRHMLLIVSLTILGLIVGGVAWYLLLRYDPKYTARTYVRVLSPEEKDPMTIGRGVGNETSAFNHRESLTRLLTRQSNFEELVNRDKVRETKWFKRFGEIKDISIPKAIQDLGKNFLAFAEKNAEYIALSMTCSDKNESATIVNQMVDLFLDSQRVATTGEVRDKLTMLTSQLSDVENQLAEAEKALAAVRSTTMFTDFGREWFEDTYTRRVNDLQDRQNQLSLDIERYKNILTNYGRQVTGPIDEQIRDMVERDPTVTALTGQIATLETQLAGRLTKFGENHRVVRQFQEMITETDRKRESRRLEIAEQTRQANLKNARDNLTVLEGEYVQLEKMRQEASSKKADYDAARVLYGQRASIRDEIRRRRNEIDEQINKWKIMHNDPETPKVKFVGYAPVPLAVSSPMWTVYFPGGTVLGFMLGIGIAFLIELLNDLVRTPRDVTRYLHIPLLGIIPDAAEDDQVSDIDIRLVARLAPYSIMAESYRRLKTNLKLTGSTESSKALLISSCMAKDGKTSVAVNLAATLVADNKRVLLIDANFWQPSLHAIFPKPDTIPELAVQSDFGLSNLLMGQGDYQAVIRPSGIERFDIIDSGPLPSNPTEFLGCARMQDLVNQQRQNYDYVIIDGPPVLLVSDTKMLARLVDATLLVFNAGTTRRGAALRTIRELREVNAPIAGCVLLAVKILKGGYFHEQFRSYQEYQKLQLAHSV